MANRRRILACLGALSVSVGTVLTVGTTNRSVAPESDLRVVSSVAVTIRRGNNVPADDSVAEVGGVDYLNLDRSTDARISNNRLDYSSLTVSDVPVAGVNDGEDDSLVINVATGVRPGGEQLTVEALVEVVNEGSVAVTEIGINYHSYGAAVTDTGHFTEREVQDVYQFEAQPDGVDDLDSRVRISPNPGTSGSDADNRFTLDSGETAQIDVVNTNHDYTSELRSAADVSGNPWTGESSAVDLLDTIEVEGTVEE